MHAFRTPIKASVGLELHIDKGHAYNVDMEAARREAPADIEWPKLDGHLSIPALHVPLGSPCGGLRKGGGRQPFTAIERVLRVFFDPSTHGTDSNPVVADVLEELLHDPYHMAAEAATLRENAVA
eukprot:jgi/Tetstr1/459325/TSEL_004720.t1